MSEANVPDPIIRQAIELLELCRSVSHCSGCESESDIDDQNTCRCYVLWFRATAACRRLRNPDIDHLLEGISTSKQMFSCRLAIEAIRLAALDTIRANLEQYGPRLVSWPTAHQSHHEAAHDAGSKRSNATACIPAVLDQSRTSTFDSGRQDGKSKLDPRVRRSLLMIIVGLVAYLFGYRGPNSRGSSVSKVQSCLELVGLSLDDQTIRGYLDEGWELFEKKIAFPDDDIERE